MSNPYIELLIVSFIFGSSGAVIKYLQLPPTTLAFFRMAVPSIALYFFLKYRNVRIFSKNMRYMIIASFLNAFRLLLFFYGYSLASIGNATMASSTGPIFVYMFSMLILGEKPTRFKTVLLFLAFIGIIILYSNKNFSFANSDFIGMLLAMLSSAIYSLTVVIFKKELDNYSKTEAVFYQNLAGSFIFLPFIFINQPFPQIWQVGGAVVSQFFIGAVAFVMFFSALKKVSPVAASIATFDSVISVILGILLFKEVLTVNMIIGGILILTATILIRTGGAGR